jgi:hypothetical protein
MIFPDLTLVFLRVEAARRNGAGMRVAEASLPLAQRRTWRRQPLHPSPTTRRFLGAPGELRGDHAPGRHRTPTRSVECSRAGPTMWSRPIESGPPFLDRRDEADARTPLSPRLDRRPGRHPCARHDEDVCEGARLADCGHLRRERERGNASARAPRRRTCVAGVGGSGGRG